MNKFTAVGNGYVPLRLMTRPTFMCMLLSFLSDSNELYGCIPQKSSFH
jgi:hypothetical protein